MRTVVTQLKLSLVISRCRGAVIPRHACPEGPRDPTLRGLPGQPETQSLLLERNINRSLERLSATRLSIDVRLTWAKSAPSCPLLTSPLVAHRTCRGFGARRDIGFLLKLYRCSAPPRRTAFTVLLMKSSPGPHDPPAESIGRAHQVSVVTHPGPRTHLQKNSGDPSGSFDVFGRACLARASFATRVRIPRPHPARRGREVDLDVVG